MNYAKILIIVLFLFILYNLAAGLFYMMKDKGQSNRTVKSLSWRIGISVAVFILLFVLQGLGYLQPNPAPF